MNEEQQHFEELINRSSLGSAGAQELRARTSAHTARHIRTIADRGTDSVQWHADAVAAARLNAQEEADLAKELAQLAQEIDRLRAETQASKLEHWLPDFGMDRPLHRAGSEREAAEAWATPASRLGIEPGQVVQELGWDDDVDQDLRESIEELTGTELVDEDYNDVADVILLWFREDSEDGDLTDSLVDAQEYLGDGGVIWLLTPKTGREGHVEASDIADAAQTAGLSQTSTAAVSKDWSAFRLATPHTGAVSALGLHWRDSEV